MAHEKLVSDEAVQEAIDRVRQADLKSLERQYAFLSGKYDEYIARTFDEARQRLVDTEQRIRSELDALRRKYSEEDSQRP